MKYELTLKNCQLTPRSEKVFNKYLVMFEKKLTNFAEDIPRLLILIKSHEKNHFLSGIVTLTLPRKKLTATMGGHTLNEAFHQGFEKLGKEFEKYKGIHFKKSSKYPHHESIKTNNYL